MNSEKNSIYNVRLSRRAENYLRRSDRNTQKRIGAAIEAIRKQPFRGLNIRRLSGKIDYRYCLGALRIIYTVNQMERVIEIVTIGPRGDVYK